MSLTPVAAASGKITPHTLLERKQAHRPITALTAYDYATARLADEAGIELLLVGDSLAMVVMGLESTLPVTVDEMLHHTRAVRRGVRRALLVADMPYGSYHVSADEGVANGARFVKEGGAEAVKVEGARPELVERLIAAEIPVVGHIGLTPSPCIAWVVIRCRVRRPRSMRACAQKRDNSKMPEPAQWCSKACRANWLPKSPRSSRFRRWASEQVWTAMGRFWSSMTW